MVSRALGLAAVMLTLCMAGPTQAQENLEAGKSPSQIFAGTCSACHKSPRGLLKTTAPGSLPSFLRQHYTTSPEMAGVLSNYLISNGASDARYTGNQGKGGKDGKEAKSDAKPEPRSETRTGAPEQTERSGRRHRPAAASESREAAPESDGASAQDEPAHRVRHGKRSARSTPAAESKSDADGQVPAQTGERAPEGRKSATKMKRGKSRGQEASKPDAATEPPSDAALGASSSEPPKTAPSSLDDARPAAVDRADTPKIEAPASETPKASDPPPMLRADPAPAVTPAAPLTTTQSISVSPSSAASDPSIPSSPPHSGAQPDLVTPPAGSSQSPTSH